MQNTTHMQINVWVRAYTYFEFVGFTVLWIQICTQHGLSV